MHTTIKIQGTHCASCKALIEEACKEIQGVTLCEVNYETGKTVIEHKEGVDWKKLKEDIEALGDYKVQGI